MQSKSLKPFLMTALMTVSLSAVAETTVTQKTYNLPHCSKPIASIVVGKLTCKAAGCKAPQAGMGGGGLLGALLNQAGTPSLAGIGDGMAEMLTTSLKATGCFDLQEREEMDEVAKELALAGKKLQAKQADYLISGAITSANFSTKRSSFGGGFIPIVGAITKSTQQADIGMDLRLIDVNNARILDSKTFDANSQNSSYGFTGAGIVGMGGFGGSLSSLKGTAMENVARDAIAQATTYIVQTMAAAKGVQLVAPVPATPAPAPVAAH
jgi:curli biogenesis system outer membrane secretion channel CsgG